MPWPRAKMAIALAAGLMLAAATVVLVVRENKTRGRYQYRVPEKTDDGWQTGSLSAGQLQPGLIDELLERIHDQTYKNIHSLLLVRNNQLVLEEYFPGMHPVIGPTLEQQPDWNGKYQEFNRDTLHTLQSATKSVTALLVGIAIDQHLISGADETVSSFFPQLSGRKEIQLNHFLSMTAGLDWNEEVPLTDPRNDCERMNHSTDPIRLLLDRPSVVPPGARFNYNGALSLTLGEVVRRTSGSTVDQFAETNLFRPLGISSHAWKGTFPNGVLHTSGGLYLRPRDMAKIGCLMLNNGKWQGKQIVSEMWVRESTRKQTQDRNYGYQWWLGSFDVGDQSIPWFSAMGYGGQFIFVFPTRHLVVVSTGWNLDHGAQLLEMMQRYILPAAL